MAYTVIVPGRKTPYNCNSFGKAAIMYRNAKPGAMIRNNKTKASCRKWA